MKRGSKK